MKSMDKLCHTIFRYFSLALYKVHILLMVNKYPYCTLVGIVINNDGHKPVRVAIFLFHID